MLCPFSRLVCHPRACCLHPGPKRGLRIPPPLPCPLMRTLDSIPAVVRTLMANQNSNFFLREGCSSACMLTCGCMCVYVCYFVPAIRFITFVRTRFHRLAAIRPITAPVALQPRLRPPTPSPPSLRLDRHSVSVGESEADTTAAAPLPLQIAEIRRSADMRVAASVTPVPAHTSSPSYLQPQPPQTPLRQPQVRCAALE